MSCEFWLAIDSDWMPSCCWVCNACKRVEASFMSASTSELTPVVRASVRVEMKVACVLTRDCVEPSVEA